MTADPRGTQEYLKCRELEKTHVCAVCGGHLLTVFRESAQEYVSRCGLHDEHQGVKPKITTGQVVARGELDRQQGSGAQADAEKQLQASGERSPLMATRDIATGTSLSKADVHGLNIFADSVGLKAYLGHVCLYFGKPYITIDGYYYLRHARGEIWRVQTAPMTPDERKSYQVEKGDHAYLALAINADGMVLNRGIGIVTQEEINKPSRSKPDEFAAPVVHNKPQIMAEKRAEWQLLQKMIPLGLEFPAPDPPAVTVSVDKAQAEKDIKELF